jgi:hypothetical protein
MCVIESDKQVQGCLYNFPDSFFFGLVGLPDWIFRKFQDSKISNSTRKPTKCCRDGNFFYHGSRHKGGQIE